MYMYMYVYIERATCTRVHSNASAGDSAGSTGGAVGSILARPDPIGGAPGGSTTGSNKSARISSAGCARNSS